MFAPAASAPKQFYASPAGVENNMQDLSLSVDAPAAPAWYVPVAERYPAACAAEASPIPAAATEQNGGQI